MSLHVQLLLNLAGHDVANDAGRGTMYSKPHHHKQKVQKMKF